MSNRKAGGKVGNIVYNSLIDSGAEASLVTNNTLAQLKISLSTLNRNTLIKRFIHQSKYLNTFLSYSISNVLDHIQGNNFIHTQV